MQTVEFKHEIGKRVTIHANRLHGIVVGNYLGKYGQKEVLVDYADKNGLIHREYITEDEVESAGNGPDLLSACKEAQHAIGHAANENPKYAKAFCDISRAIEAAE